MQRFLAFLLSLTITFLPVTPSLSFADPIQQGDEVLDDNDFVPFAHMQNGAVQAAQQFQQMQAIANVVNNQPLPPTAGEGEAPVLMTAFMAPRAAFLVQAVGGFTLAQAPDYTDQVAINGNYTSSWNFSNTNDSGQVVTLLMAVTPPGEDTIEIYENVDVPVGTHAVDFNRTAAELSALGVGPGSYTVSFSAFTGNGDRIGAFFGNTLTIGESDVTLPAAPTYTGTIPEDTNFTATWDFGNDGNISGDVTTLTVITPAGTSNSQEFYATGTVGADGTEIEVTVTAAELAAKGFGAGDYVVTFKAFDAQDNEIAAFFGNVLKIGNSDFSMPAVPTYDPTLATDSDLVSRWEFDNAGSVSGDVTLLTVITAGGVSKEFYRSATIGADGGAAIATITHADLVAQGVGEGDYTVTFKAFDANDAEIAAFFGNTLKIGTANVGLAAAPTYNNRIAEDADLALTWNFSNTANVTGDVTLLTVLTPAGSTNPADEAVEIYVTENVAVNGENITTTLTNQQLIDAFIASTGITQANYATIEREYYDLRLIDRFGSPTAAETARLNKLESNLSRFTGLSKAEFNEYVDLRYFIGPLQQSVAQRFSQLSAIVNTAFAAGGKPSLAGDYVVTFKAFNEADAEINAFFGNTLKIGTPDISLSAVPTYDDSIATDADFVSSWNFANAGNVGDNVTLLAVVTANGVSEEFYHSGTVPADGGDIIFTITNAELDARNIGEGDYTVTFKAFDVADQVIAQHFGNTLRVGTATIHVNIEPTFDDAIAVGADFTGSWQLSNATGVSGDVTLLTVVTPLGSTDPNDSNEFYRNTTVPAGGSTVDIVITAAELAAAGVGEGDYVVTLKAFDEADNEIRAFFGHALRVGESDLSVADAPAYSNQLAVPNVGTTISDTIDVQRVSSSSVVFNLEAVSTTSFLHERHQRNFAGPLLEHRDTEVLNLSTGELQRTIYRRENADDGTGNINESSMTTILLPGHSGYQEAFDRLLNGVNEIRTATPFELGNTQAEGEQKIAEAQAIYDAMLAIQAQLDATYFTSAWTFANAADVSGDAVLRVGITPAGSTDPNDTEVIELVAPVAADGGVVQFGISALAFEARGLGEGEYDITFQAFDATGQNAISAEFANSLRVGTPSVGVSSAPTYAGQIAQGSDLTESWVLSNNTGVSGNVTFLTVITPAGSTDPSASVEIYKTGTVPAGGATLDVVITAAELAQFGTGDFVVTFKLFDETDAEVGAFFGNVLRIGTSDPSLPAVPEYDSTIGVDDDFVARWNLNNPGTVSADVELLTVITANGVGHEFYHNDVVPADGGPIVTTITDAQLNAAGIGEGDHVVTFIAMDANGDRIGQFFGNVLKVGTPAVGVAAAPTYSAQVAQGADLVETWTFTNTAGVSGDVTLLTVITPAGSTDPNDSVEIYKTATVAAGGATLDVTLTAAELAQFGTGDFVVTFAAFDSEDQVINRFFGNVLRIGTSAPALAAVPEFASRIGVDDDFDARWNFNNPGTTSADVELLTVITVNGVGHEFYHAGTVPAGGGPVIFSITDAQLNAAGIGEGDHTTTFKAFDANGDEIGAHFGNILRIGTPAVDVVGTPTFTDQIPADGDLTINWNFSNTAGVSGDVTLLTIFTTVVNGVQNSEEVYQTVNIPAGGRGIELTFTNAELIAMGLVPGGQFTIGLRAFDEADAVIGGILGQPFEFGIPVTESPTAPTAPARIAEDGDLTTSWTFTNTGDAPDTVNLVVSLTPARDPNQQTNRQFVTPTREFSNVFTVPVGGATIDYVITNAQLVAAGIDAGDYTMSLVALINDGSQASDRIVESYGNVLRVGTAVPALPTLPEFDGTIGVDDNFDARWNLTNTGNSSSDVTLLTVITANGVSQEFYNTGTIPVGGGPVIVSISNADLDARNIGEGDYLVTFVAFDESDNRVGQFFGNTLRIGTPAVGLAAAPTYPAQVPAGTDVTETWTFTNTAGVSGDVTLLTVITPAGSTDPNDSVEIYKTTTVPAGGATVDIVLTAAELAQFGTGDFIVTFAAFDAEDQVINRFFGNVLRIGTSDPALAAVPEYDSTIGVDDNFDARWNFNNPGTVSADVELLTVITANGVAHEFYHTGTIPANGGPVIFSITDAQLNAAGIGEGDHVVTFKAFDANGDEIGAHFGNTLRIGTPAVGLAAAPTYPAQVPAGTDVTETWTFTNTAGVSGDVTLLTVITPAGSTDPNDSVEIYKTATVAAGGATVDVTLTAAELAQFGTGDFIVTFAAFDGEDQVINRFFGNVLRIGTSAPALAATPEFDGTIGVDDNFDARWNFNNPGTVSADVELLTVITPAGSADPDAAAREFNSSGTVPANGGPVIFSITNAQLDAVNFGEGDYVVTFKAFDANGNEIGAHFGNILKIGTPAVGLAAAPSFPGRVAEGADLTESWTFTNTAGVSGDVTLLTVITPAGSTDPNDSVEIYKTASVAAGGATVDVTLTAAELAQFGTGDFIVTFAAFDGEDQVINRFFGNVLRIGAADVALPATPEYDSTIGVDDNFDARWNLTNTGNTSMDVELVTSITTNGVTQEFSNPGTVPAGGGPVIVSITNAQLDARNIGEGDHVVTFIAFDENGNRVGEFFGNVLRIGTPAVGLAAVPTYDAQIAVDGDLNQSWTFTNTAGVSGDVTLLTVITPIGSTDPDASKEFYKDDTVAPGGTTVNAALTAAELAAQGIVPGKYVVTFAAYDFEGNLISRFFGNLLQVGTPAAGVPAAPTISRRIAEDADLTTSWNVTNTGDAPETVNLVVSITPAGDPSATTSEFSTAVNVPVGGLSTDFTITDAQLNAANLNAGDYVVSLVAFINDGQEASDRIFESFGNVLRIGTASPALPALPEFDGTIGVDDNFDARWNLTNTGNSSSDVTLLTVITANGVSEEFYSTGTVPAGGGPVIVSISNADLDARNIGEGDYLVTFVAFDEADNRVGQFFGNTLRIGTPAVGLAAAPTYPAQVPVGTDVTETWTFTNTAGVSGDVTLLTVITPAGSTDPNDSVEIYKTATVAAGGATVDVTLTAAELAQFGTGDFIVTFAAFDAEDQVINRFFGNVLRIGTSAPALAATPEFDGTIGVDDNFDARWNFNNPGTTSAEVELLTVITPAGSADPDNDAREFNSSGIVPANGGPVIFSITNAQLDAVNFGEGDYVVTFKAFDANGNEIGAHFGNVLKIGTPAVGLAAAPSFPGRVAEGADLTESWTFTNTAGVSGDVVLLTVITPAGSTDPNASVEIYKTATVAAGGQNVDITLTAAELAQFGTGDFIVTFVAFDNEDNVINRFFGNVLRIGTADVDLPAAPEYDSTIGVDDNFDARWNLTNTGNTSMEVELVTVITANGTSHEISSAGTVPAGGGPVIVSISNADLDARNIGEGDHLVTFIAIDENGNRVGEFFGNSLRIGAPAVGLAAAPSFPAQVPAGTDVTESWVFTNTAGVSGDVTLLTVITPAGGSSDQSVEIYSTATVAAGGATVDVTLTAAQLAQFGTGDFIVTFAAYDDQDQVINRFFGNVLRIGTSAPALAATPEFDGTIGVDDNFDARWNFNNPGTTSADVELLTVITPAGSADPDNDAREFNSSGTVPANGGPVIFSITNAQLDAVNFGEGDYVVTFKAFDANGNEIGAHFGNILKIGTPAVGLATAPSYPGRVAQGADLTESWTFANTAGVSGDVVLLTVITPAGSTDPNASVEIYKTASVAAGGQTLDITLTAAELAQFGTGDFIVTFVAFDNEDNVINRFFGNVLRIGTADVDLPAAPEYDSTIGVDDNFDARWNLTNTGNTSMEVELVTVITANGTSHEISSAGTVPAGGGPVIVSISNADLDARNIGEGDHLVTFIAIDENGNRVGEFFGNSLRIGTPAVGLAAAPSYPAQVAQGADVTESWVFTNTAGVSGDVTLLTVITPAGSTDPNASVEIYKTATVAAGGATIDVTLTAAELAQFGTGDFIVTFVAFDDTDTVINRFFGNVLRIGTSAPALAATPEFDGTIGVDDNFDARWNFNNPGTTSAEVELLTVITPAGSADPDNDAREFNSSGIVPANGGPVIFSITNAQLDAVNFGEGDYVVTFKAFDANGNEIGAHFGNVLKIGTPAVGLAAAPSFPGRVAEGADLTESWTFTNTAGVSGDVVLLTVITPAGSTDPNASVEIYKNATVAAGGQNVDITLTAAELAQFGTGDFIVTFVAFDNEDNVINRFFGNVLRIGTADVALAATPEFDSTIGVDDNFDARWNLTNTGNTSMDVELVTVITTNGVSQEFSNPGTVPAGGGPVIVSITNAQLDAVGIGEGDHVVTFIAIDENGDRVGEFFGNTLRVGTPAVGLAAVPTYDAQISVNGDLNQSWVFTNTAGVSGDVTLLTVITPIGSTDPNASKEFYKDGTVAPGGTTVNTALTAAELAAQGIVPGQYVVTFAAYDFEGNLINRFFGNLLQVGTPSAGVPAAPTFSRRIAEDADLTTSWSLTNTGDAPETVNLVVSITPAGGDPATQTREFSDTVSVPVGGLNTDFTITDAQLNAAGLNAGDYVVNLVAVINDGSQASDRIAEFPGNVLRIGTQNAALPAVPEYDSTIGVDDNFDARWNLTNTGNTSGDVELVTVITVNGTSHEFSNAGTVPAGGGPVIVSITNAQLDAVGVGEGDHVVTFIAIDENGDRVGQFFGNVLRIGTPVVGVAAAPAYSVQVAQGADLVETWTFTNTAGVSGDVTLLTVITPAGSTDPNDSVEIYKTVNVPAGGATIDVTLTAAELAQFGTGDFVATFAAFDAEDQVINRFFGNVLRIGTSDPALAAVPEFAAAIGVDDNFDARWNFNNPGTVSADVELITVITANGVAHEFYHAGTVPANGGPVIFSITNAQLDAAGIGAGEHLVTFLANDANGDRIGQFFGNDLKIGVSAARLLTAPTIPAQIASGDDLVVPMAFTNTGDVSDAGTVLFVFTTVGDANSSVEIYIPDINVPVGGGTQNVTVTGDQLTNSGVTGRGQQVVTVIFFDGEGNRTDAHFGAGVIDVGNFAPTFDTTVAPAFDALVSTEGVFTTRFTIGNTGDAQGRVTLLATARLVSADPNDPNSFTDFSQAVTVPIGGGEFDLVVDMSQNNLVAGDYLFGFRVLDSSNTPVGPQANPDERGSFGNLIQVVDAGTPLDFFVTQQVPSAPGENLLEAWEIPLNDPLTDILKDRASSYDQAVGAMVLLASGQFDLAKEILDAVVLLENNTGKLGFTYSVGAVGAESLDVFTGTNAWVGMAALMYEQVTGDDRYRAMATRIGDNLLRYQDATTGLLSRGEAADGTLLTGMSTEHNIDAYFFLRDLGIITGQARFSDAANEIEAGIMAELFDTDHFRQGAGDDVLALDAQTLGIAFLLATGRRPLAQLVDTFVENNFAVTVATTGGNVTLYAPYNQDTFGWLEGSAQYAFAKRRLGETAAADTIELAIEAFRLSSGGIQYATSESIVQTPGAGGDIFPDNANIASTAWGLLEFINPAELLSPDADVENVLANVNAQTQTALDANFEIIVTLQHEGAPENVEFLTVFTPVGGGTAIEDSSIINVVPGEQVIPDFVSVALRNIHGIDPGRYLVSFILKDVGTGAEVGRVSGHQWTLGDIDLSFDNQPDFDNQVDGSNGEDFVADFDIDNAGNAPDTVTTTVVLTPTSGGPAIEINRTFIVTPGTGDLFSFRLTPAELIQLNIITGSYTMTFLAFDSFGNRIGDGFFGALIEFLLD